MCCTGFTARAVTFDGQVIGHHLVAHICLGNAFERDGVAHNVGAVKQHRICLGLFDTGLLCARDFQANTAQGHGQACKAFAACFGCKDQRTAVGRHTHLTTRQTVEQVTQLDSHIGQGLVGTGCGTAVLEVRGDHAIHHRRQTVHMDADEVPGFDRAGQSQNRQITQTLCIERHQHAAIEQSHIGVAVTDRAQGQPSGAAIC